MECLGQKLPNKHSLTLVTAGLTGLLPSFIIDLQTFITAAIKNHYMLTHNLKIQTLNNYVTQTTTTVFMQ